MSLGGLGRVCFDLGCLGVQLEFAGLRFRFWASCVSFRNEGFRFKVQGLRELLLKSTLESRVFSLGFGPVSP